MVRLKRSMHQRGFAMLEVMIAAAMLIAVVFVLMNAFKDKVNYSSIQVVARHYAVLTNNVMTEVQSEYEDISDDSASDFCGDATTTTMTDYLSLDDTSDLNGVGVYPSQVSMVGCLVYPATSNNTTCVTSCSMDDFV